MADRHELAHINVARLKAPYDDPLLADFVARIGEVNAIGDASEGFVWRLPDGSAEAGPDPFNDPMLLINLSVWTDLKTLRAFVYGGAHAEVMRGRRRWFDRGPGPGYVLWWIPAGSRPTLVEAKERLARLARDGATLQAFTFDRAFAPPGAGGPG